MGEKPQLIFVIAFTADFFLFLFFFHVHISFYRFLTLFCSFVMEAFKIHLWLAALSCLAQTYQSAELTSEEIQNFDTSAIKEDAQGVEIDQLMSNGGDDEITQPSQSEEEDQSLYHRLMMASKNGTMDPFFAPSDKSYEHFSKLAAGSYTMEDVKEYERQNDNTRFKLW